MKDLAALFKALADETRLRIVNLLLERELCVCELVDILGMSQPRISRHLNILRQAGLLSSWREGRWTHYAIAGELSDYYRTLLDGLRWRSGQSELRQTDLGGIKKVLRDPGEPCPAEQSK